MIAVGALVLVACAAGAFLFRNHLGAKPVPCNQLHGGASRESAGKAGNLERQHHRRRLHQQDRRPGF